VVVGRATLRQYVQHSRAAVAAEIASPLRLWEAPDGSQRQPIWRVRVLETLRGEALPESLDVFAHGEGLPRFDEGDRVLLFLERTAERPEFAALAERFPWFTGQEPGEEWRLDRDAGAGDAVLAAARRWAAWTDAPREQQASGLRSLLLEEVTSPVPRLRDDGVSELMSLAGRADAFPDAESLAPFVAVARSTRLPLGPRLVLLDALGRNPAWDAGEAWHALVKEPHGAAELARLATAAGARSDPALSVWLRTLLAHPDAGVRRAAAAALGHPRHAGAEPSLAGAARDPDPCVARAAIRSLAALETAASRRALAALADGGHPERARWAKAALRRDASRSGAGR
jgi:HEAT repeats